MTLSGGASKDFQIEARGARSGLSGRNEMGVEGGGEIGRLSLLL